MDDTAVEAMARSSGDARFAYDSYRRVIQMFCNVVLDLSGHDFEDILKGFKQDKGYVLDTDLLAGNWQEVISRYRAHVLSATGRPFPPGLCVVFTVSHPHGSAGSCTSSSQNLHLSKKSGSAREHWSLLAIYAQKRDFGKHDVIKR